ncbi:hypothetical protein [Acinetobacter sp. MD2]|uniref:hypothetical protein n=1 Tax=Acinetobacter sp. MD2 TaxID=2600066 RepID=UPI002D1ED892|nr:hypothetical protein [Acinetobacter sp. MD2]MEB3767177.1 hypothetical protein [Acinetobacter sp. MD2]
MLIYIIPFVLLLVVAIVLKKRESTQQQNESKKPQTLKGKKKAKSAKGSSASTSNAVKTAAAETPVTAEASPTAPAEISPEFRSQIEGLIQTQNFGTAEALINQQLNQNKDQYELYFLLANVHIAQQDTFALDQLRSHLRALQLSDVVQYIEDTLKKDKDTRDTIQYKPAQLSNTADFENKSSTQVTPTTPDLVSFDALKQDSSSTAQSSEAFVTNEVDTNLDLTSEAIKDTTTLPTLNFSLETPSIETKGPSSTSPTNVTATVLDFDFADSNIQIEPTAKETKTAQVSEDLASNLMEFNFQLEPSATETKSDVLVSTPEPEPALSTFKLEPSSKEIIIEQSVEDSLTAPFAEFKFEFETAETIAQTQVDVVTEEKETKVEAPALDFAFEPLGEPIVTAVTEVPAVEFEATVPTVEDEVVTTTPILVENIAAHIDPILQQFPELAAMKSTELDLRLAEQYIKLGATDAARDLLAAQPHFDADEAEQAKNLLNQIAS